jgi:hypothetical protein
VGERGPPPKSLIRLFWLLKEDPCVSDLELALQLDVEVESVPVYRWRLKNLLSDITSYCPHCFSKNVWADRENGERVCTACGVVLEQEASMIHTLPFDETYAPTSNIAFGKNLGAPLSYKGTYRVLVKSHKKEGKGQVPIRQLTAVTEQVDPPVIRNMLNYASNVLKSLGLNCDTDSCHLLADYVGKIVREAASVLSLGNWDIKPYLVVRACVFYVMKKAMPSRTDEFLAKYRLNPKAVRFLSKVLELKIEIERDANQKR